VLVLEKTYLADSGGPGRHRGGLGQRVRLRKLVDDGLATLVAVYPEGVDNLPEGLFGGHAGSAARGAILDADGALVHDCGTGELVSVDRTDRIVEVVLAGGAGYGDPRDRNRQDVEDDIINERVTAAGAQRDYGMEPASLRAAE
jgi:5-oxoprolinase (ATP-hydrolysing)/N-methylhydantoinase A